MKHFNLKRAVPLALLAALFLTIMAMMVKLISNDLPTNTIIFVRFFIGFIYILFLIGHQKQFKKSPVSLTPKSWPLHLLRAIGGLAAMFFLYYALRYIPLVDGVLLATTAPLFVPILAFIFLKVKTPLTIWGAIILGFIGVIFVLKPTPGLFNPVALFALMAGFCGAISFISLRLLSGKHHTHNILFYYFFVTALVSGIMCLFDWKMPTAYQWTLLILIGVTGTAYQECLTRATKYAPSRVVSPILYFDVVFSAILGWLIWAHLPDFVTWIGIILVCIGAILVVLLSNPETLSKKIGQK